MKRPDSLPQDDPEEWMDHARSDLRLAQNRMPGLRLEHLCFHAQQAAEKAVKALMIGRDVEFPYVHDLNVLLSLLADAGEPVPESVRLSRRLTPYAAAARYPGIAERVTEDDHAEAVQLAEGVVRWVRERLQQLRAKENEHV